VAHLVLQEPFRALFYAPFYSMLARGVLARRGLSAELVAAGSLETATTALLEGRVDVGWGGPMRLLLAREADPATPLRCFGAAVVRDPFLLVGRGENPGFRLQDLAGLRLGTVSEVATPWWCLQDDLRRLGLDPAALRREGGASMAAQVAQLLSGALDVAQVLEPHASLAKPQEIRVWHAAATRGPTAYTAFYTTTARIAADAASLRQLRDALGETLTWIGQTPPEEIAGTVAPFFPDLSPALLAHALGRYQGLQIWGDDVTCFPSGALERLEDAMYSAGALRTHGNSRAIFTKLD
jgi:NitT/TauT family transport system substrate-binding protein